MKKIPFLVLSLLAMNSYAGVFDALNSYQNTLQPKPDAGTPGSTTVTGSKPDVTPSATETQSSSIACNSQDQTSLPLANLTSLFLEKNGALNITYHGDTGKLTITSPKMISNCNSMLEWTVKQPTIKGQKSYAVEVKFKKGEKCNDATNECVYSVDRAENGEFKQKDEMVFKPTLKGFEECLQKTGVVANGKVVPGAIQNDTINESFDGLKTSAPLYFLSNGMQSKQVGPKYGKEFVTKNGCDHYEYAHPEIKMLLTTADAERQRLDSEAAKLKDCKVEEYGKLATFINNYQEYQDQLGNVRDKLILEAVKKTVAALDKGTAKPEDLKVIEDFNAYIVAPKIKRAQEIYNELAELEGDARKVKEDELVKILAELAALNNKPYFEKGHIQKLIAAGLFKEAEDMSSLRITLQNFSRLGTLEQGEKQTVPVVERRIKQDKDAFAGYLKIQKQEYMVKTGQENGPSVALREQANQLRRDLQFDYNREAQNLYQYQQDISPGGYCYHPVRVNPQKCIQERMVYIQNIQTYLKKRTEETNAAATPLDEQAKKWEELEAQGRRYIAAQRGEAAPADVKPKVEPVVPEFKMPEEQQRGGYTFQWNGQQQGQQQYQPQQYQQGYQQMYPQQQYSGYQPQYQQQYNPYGYHQQSPFMGQQAYQMPNQYGMHGQGGYNFNWGGGGYQQPQYGYQQQYGGYQQQMPYYQQPYQAYGGYSFYGRRW